MRTRPRKDRNHADITSEFHRLGAFVVDLSMVGNGVPDVFVCLNSICLAVEIKDGSRPPSKRALTNDQVDWWMKAKINPRVVKDMADVLATVNVLKAWDAAIKQGVTNG